MAFIAILIGIYSYLVFALGIAGLIYPRILLGISLAFLLVIIKNITVIKIITIIKANRFILFLAFLFLAQVGVNLVGALGPELGFDALWYHLTLPKLYLQNNRLVFVPGNLLYYSAMPKLLEMLYLSSLAISGEILAKIIHFSFGILSAISLYNLSRKFLNQEEALLVSVIFYTTLVVGWQSITAYVDLGRTFFEILALDYFLRWHKNSQKRDLLESAVMLGLAISTKLLAMGSIFIFCFLIIFKIKIIKVINIIKNIFTFIFFALLIPLPWFVFSFVHTGNPFYPLFTGILDSTHQITSFNVLRFFTDFWGLFLKTADPLSPIILIFLPVFVAVFKKFSKIEKIVVWYCFFSYVVWFFTPRIGGGRFILPYLPAFCLVGGLCLKQLRKRSFLKITATIFIIIITVINIIYRAGANGKYLPVVLGKQTKADFLTKNLNFAFGDFYDTDQFFINNINPEDLVLVYGIHNFFYVSFPFVHQSWATPGTAFTHILVKGNQTPDLVKKKRLIYYNPQTETNLYIFGNKYQ